MKRFFIALLAVLIVAISTPAYASTGYFVTKVTGISPAFPGVSAAATDGGDVTVLNEGSQPLVVDGYFSEPFIRIGSSGVWQNKRSPSVYLDQSTTIGTLPSNPNAASVAPEWVKLDTQQKYTWHDHRTHWMSDALPPAAAADPKHAHLIERWTIPITVGATKGVIEGTLTYEPSSHVTTYITWGAIGFVVIGFLYIQFVLQPRRMRRAVAAAKEE